MEILSLKRKHHAGDGDIDGKKSKQSLTKNREVATVLVKNLPKSANQTKLRKYFHDCGDIVQIDVMETLDKGGRIARIEFSSHDEVLAALTKTYKKFGQNEITVTKLENCTIWLTNFPPNYRILDLRNIFVQNNVLPLSIRLPSLRYNSNRRFAYVDVISPDIANEMVNYLNEMVIDGFKVVAKLSNPLEKSDRSDAALLEHREIYITNLDSDQITEQKLSEWFSKFGDIERIKLVKNENEPGNTSYAFISFTSSDSATKALELHKETLEGNTITVTLANKKSYLERQEVKRIIYSNRRQNDDLMISLYPLSDKTSKSQVSELLTTNLNIQEADINKILLVSDYQSAIVIMKNRQIAAKCLMALDGIQFQKKKLHCTTIDGMKRSQAQRQKPSSNPQTTYPSENFNITSSKVQTASKSNINKIEDNGSNQNDTSTKPMSNDDFRKMFLGK
ncbi:hypothetical protein Kpol_1069p8 [Vanderwaltozyma polyspora DSM 70294]|uniref:RRM domain-containing protein n=1 Tax=Vanderwaltozyma polyspora (strain ATCC 22028 / DSM 70294 / BCRC 21397 / CBS 2163 / NBRC 10782 / NRRL Y-8283 / UCD 57-17) TaxID=436907 RepID=A7TRB8_VANPO|nr:uncharacterized protein Kpol_1069p8 [Vanderwaltozyma polyspora DSM 70294]EDO15186.1 hypothetical protein Kpol_1069p8 [Vanderwaltozyma polyspora DSM 70294]